MPASPANAETAIGSIRCLEKSNIFPKKLKLSKSMDFRPEIGIIGNYGKDTDLDIALSLRYQF